MTVRIRQLTRATVISSPLPPPPPPPPPPSTPAWELISSSTLFYNPGYCPIILDTRGANLIVLSFGTIVPPELGFFFDTPENAGWQMATVFNSTMAWILNPANVSESHLMVLQGINFATVSGAAFHGNMPELISSANTASSTSTAVVAADPVPITNPRQLVLSGLGGGQYYPAEITGPPGYVSFIRESIVSADGSGAQLHGSGLAYKLPQEGTEEQPVWTGHPAGPMSTRTLVFEATET